MLPVTLEWKVLKLNNSRRWNSVLVTAHTEKRLILVFQKGRPWLIVKVYYSTSEFLVLYNLVYSKGVLLRTSKKIKAQFKGEGVAHTPLQLSPGKWKLNMVGIVETEYGKEK